MRQYHDLLSNVFFLTEPKNFVEEPFCVSEGFKFRKKLWMRWQGVAVSRYSAEIFLSHSTEDFCREPLCTVFQKVSCGEKLMGEGGRARAVVSRLSSESLLSQSPE